LQAQCLEREANQLVVIAETLHTLRGALRREEIEVVNKPAIMMEEEKCT